MSTNFNVAPEKQASIPRFFYKQIRFKPAEVVGVNLKGKTAIVTGSNVGIGFETSRQLLDLGLSKLILAVRNEEKGNVAAEKLALGRTVAEGTIEVWKLDLSQYDSIASFTERCKNLDRLDIVILNAGISPAEQVFNDQTGHDECIQVNYLSTALLAILLVSIVKSKRANQLEPSRLTFVSSEVAGWTSFKQRNDFPLLAALDKPGKVEMLDQYMISKLLGQFFITELARIVPPSVALINCTSPATVWETELNREHDKTWPGAIVKFIKKWLAYTASTGARMITDAAVNHGPETHGRFLSFQELVPMAPIVYTREGKSISQQLWKETMAELSFAKVQEILRGIETE